MIGHWERDRQPTERRRGPVHYHYSRLTWADGASSPPLVSVSGKVDSLYRGLNAFEERDAAFFFGRETTATQVLERMALCLHEAVLLVVSGVSGAAGSRMPSETLMMEK